MKCPDEFILGQFADGELPEIETSRIALHTATCTTCGERVRSLKAENRLLVQSLQAVDEWEPAIAPVYRVARAAAALIAASVLLRLGFGIAAGIEPAPVIDWVFPFSLSAKFGWLANALFYAIENGGSIVSQLISRATYVILSLLALGVLFAAARRLRVIAAPMTLLMFMCVLAVPSYAIEVRKSEKGIVTVSSDETIDDTLIVFANAVTVSGTVTGDLVAFARQVNIQGTVHGNVIGFGQRVEVTGDVQGDIFGFGQSVRTAGHVGRNLWGFGQNVAITRGGKTEQNATLFGADVNIDGEVGRDLTAFAGTMDLASRIGRDLRFHGGEFMAHSPSFVGRDLTVRVGSEKDLQIDPGVTVQGKKTISFEGPEPNRYLTVGFYISQLIRLGAAFLAGLLLFWLFPGLRRISLETGREVLVSGGMGFLIAVATPVAALILAITVIGLPIALSGLALWLLGLYLAKIVVAQRIGSAILGRNSDTIVSTVPALLAGLSVVIIAVNLPFIGGILNFLLILIGFGALVLYVYQLFSGRRPVEP